MPAGIRLRETSSTTGIRLVFVDDNDQRFAACATLLVGFVIVIFGAVAAIQLAARSVPEASASVVFPASSPLGEAKQPALPRDGASVVSVTGLGTIGSAGTTFPRSIASVTKMMTAYVILKSKPLQPGQTGPSIQITAAEVARWQQMIREDQSTVGVVAGQALTQLQLLQGALIPSANNYAEILANWDAGSVEAFVQKMNAEAQALGMANTRYADPSGFHPGNTSTPQDQLLLARAAMQNPVFASIVGTQSLQLPSAGTVTNVNQLLGIDGVVGIKTGMTEEAGGNLAFAARREVSGQSVEVVGVVLGQFDRPAAFTATRAILQSLYANLQVSRVIEQGQAFASIQTEWGEDVDVVVSEDVQALVWPGMTMKTNVEFEDISPGKRAGDQVGWLNVAVGEQAQRVPLVLAEDLPEASLIWRLTRL
jgi:serine-type D-Ala-D-Ala carboxypeptidase (penicillin-binding protein 5/6)